ncbi:MAG: 3'-5' exonuclease [Bdellovibrio sp.]|nr:MAG: 3'-5' exonuclease [Bdellovibrio sp.]
MRFIAFDLETTGTIPGVDRICEIGAVRFVDGVVESYFATLINPQMSIPEGASRVNQITNEMVKDKPTIDQILGPFAEFCGDDILVAHNAIFDYQFLKADIVKLETPSPKGVVLDTYPMSKKVFPGLPNYKLGTLIQHLKMPTDQQFHRAEEDATYCGRLFIEIVKKVSGTGSGVPLENLIALTGKPALYFPQVTAQPKQLELF